MKNHQPQTIIAINNRITKVIMPMVTKAYQQPNLVKRLALMRYIDAMQAIMLMHEFNQIAINDTWALLGDEPMVTDILFSEYQPIELEEQVFLLWETGMDWEDIAREVNTPLSILLTYSSILDLYGK